MVPAGDVADEGRIEDPAATGDLDGDGSAARTRHSSEADCGRLV